MSQRISRWALLSTISAITALGSFAHAQLTRPRGFSMTAHEFLALPPEGRAEFILALRQWSAKVEKIQSVVSFKESGGSDASQVAAGISFEMFASAEAAAGGASPQGTCVVAGMVSRRVSGGCSAQAAIKQMNENFGFLYENGKAPAPSECGAGQMPCSPLQGVSNTQGNYICTKYSQTFGRQALSDQCLKVQSGGDKSGKLAASFLANSIEDELTAASGECSLMDVINNINVADDKVPDALSAAFDKIVAEKPNCKVSKLEARFNDFNKVCTDAAARSLDVPCKELRERGDSIRKKYKSDLIAQLGRKKSEQVKVNSSTCTVPVQIAGQTYNYTVTSKYKTNSKGELTGRPDGFEIKQDGESSPAWDQPIKVSAVKSSSHDAIVEYKPAGSQSRQIQVTYQLSGKGLSCSTLLVPVNETPEFNCGSSNTFYCRYEDPVVACPEGSDKPYASADESMADYQLVGDVDYCDPSSKYALDVFREGGSERMGRINFDRSKDSVVDLPGNEDTPLKCAAASMFNNRYADKGQPKGRPLSAESLSRLKAKLEPYKYALKGPGDRSLLAVLLQKTDVSPSVFAKEFCQGQANQQAQQRAPASEQNQKQDADKKQSIWKKIFPFGKKSKGSVQAKGGQSQNATPSAAGLQLVELDISGEKTWACANLSEKDLKSNNPVEVQVSGPYVRIYDAGKGKGAGCPDKKGEALDIQLDPKSAGIRPNLVAWNFKRYYADSREPYFEVGVKDGAGGKEKWDCNANKKEKAKQKAENNKKSSLYVRTRQCDTKRDDDFSAEDHLKNFEVHSWKNPTTGEETRYVCREEFEPGKGGGSKPVLKPFAQLVPHTVETVDGKTITKVTSPDAYDFDMLNKDALRVPFSEPYILSKANSRCDWRVEGRETTPGQSLKSLSPRSGRPAIR
jgi:hypothetical protein